MGLVGGINQLINLYVVSLRLLGNGRIWLLLGIWFALNLLLLLGHTQFTSPIFWGPISLWIQVFGDQMATGFTHYPGHYLLLANFFGWARFILGIVIEGLLLGGIAIVFYEQFAGDDPQDRTHTRSLVPRWIHLTAAWLLINGIAALLNVYLPQWLDQYLRYSPRRNFVFVNLVMPGMYMLLVGMFFIVIARVAIFGDHVFRAAKRSLLLFVHRPFMMLTLSFTLLVIPIIISLVLARPDILVNKFRPELVFWVLLAGLVVDMVVFFLWMGTASRLLYDDER